MTEIGEPRGASAPDADGGERLRLCLLGPVQAWCGERELELGPPQQRSLLTALALRARRIVSVDELLDALWEEPPARAAAIVRTYVSRLRRVLEPDRVHPTVLVSSGSGYVLRLPADCVDAEVFEDRVAAAGRARALGDTSGALGLLREACGLWHGEPLAGLPGPLAQAHRARLVERRLNAVQAWLETELETGRHAEAIGELTVWVSRYPLLEPMRELLMLALYRGGRQAEALGVYADARRALLEQLGVDPGPRLRELHLGILSGDPKLAAPAAPAVPPPPAEPPAPPAPARPARPPRPSRPPSCPRTSPTTPAGRSSARRCARTWRRTARRCRWWGSRAWAGWASRRWRCTSRTRWAGSTRTGSCT
ncbi:AfsR/SARP family transcriptional regulator [Kitasatospora sp. NA04385]|uniref:AfsR/SARP family transcriptional regulator n=1 Tax=Kitasatospora sp. NA04385 TaxID=2742135 RepID=UPI00159101FB|nr:AfsR/SARP family transcriptional regulator [Kitasatospora sp. NA04385]QKW23082.1 AfsR/SARP family transcriptional regulator [Kitasatospora sp. NA04385]